MALKVGLSLGAGWQSTVMLLMVKDRLLQADYAVFADTQWEPPAVYRHLDWLDTVTTIPIHRVGRGNLKSDALDPEHRFASMPLFCLNKDGVPGMLRRQCTKEYKLAPILAQARKLGATRKAPHAMLIGFTTDEVARMADSRVQYLVNRFPLAFDFHMARRDCRTWLTDRGYPVPPKSACIGCPLHDDGVWREMRDERPVDWADAVAFDRAIRHSRPALLSPLFLHPSLQPLDEVDLSTAEDHGQTRLELVSCSPFGCETRVA